MSDSLRKQLAEFKPTLLHIATPDVLGFQAQSWAITSGVPIVCSYHTHFTSYLKCAGSRVRVRDRTLNPKP